jgi:hypothetical protein
VTDYNTIRLINIESSRKYTILSYRVKTRDLGDNGTHEITQHDNSGHVSTWLRSDRSSVKSIEDMIITNRSYESWACDTLRRRLMGLNKLPNLDSLFEVDADEVLANEETDSDTSSFMRAAAQEMLTMDDLEMFSEMFCDDASESEESDNDIIVETERLKLEEFEGSQMQDMSWLDYVKMPFKPGIAVDSAVTNRYFDDFIEIYTDSFGKKFLNYFVKKPETMRSLVEFKRNRELEDKEIFSIERFDEIV